MALTISQYSSLVFGFGVGVNYECSGETDKEYGLGAPTIVGTTGTLDCVTGPAQSITIGAPGFVQNMYWGGVSDRFWQQVDWRAQTNYNFGIYGSPTISVNGCYMDAECSGGYVALNYLGFARTTAVLQSSNMSSCIVRVSFGGQIKFSEDSVMKVYQDDGSGNWILLASKTCPANQQNNQDPALDTYADVTFTGSDVGNSFHFKSEVIHNGGIVTNADCYITIGSLIEQMPPIDSAENSFIQFGNGIDDVSCGIVRNVCYPVIGMDDVQFQLVVDAAANGAYNNFPNNILGDGITSGTQLFLCICDDCSIPTAITQSANFDDSVALLNEWERDGDTWDFVNKLINWGNLENYLFTHYQTNQCFRICLCQRVPAEGQPGEWVDDVLGCMTDCFQLIDSPCYTSAIEYYSNTNNYCFHYIEGSSFVNKIRLPMYLRSPQYPSTEKGYQKSNGDFVKLSERINEEWLLEVGWIPGTWHKSLKIALGHDYFHLDNTVNSGINEYMYCNQPYDILWEKKRWPYPLAKGATKLFKQINLCSVNSNC